MKKLYNPFTFWLSKTEPFAPKPGLSRPGPRRTFTAAAPGGRHPAKQVVSRKTRFSRRCLPTDAELHIMRAETSKYPPDCRHSYSAIWPPRRWIKRLAGSLRMELLTTNDHADLRMGMH